VTVKDSARQLPEGSTLVSCDEHQGTRPLRRLELRLWKVPQEGGERKGRALITRIMTGASPSWWRKATRGA